MPSLISSLQKFITHVITDAIANTICNVITDTITDAITYIITNTITITAFPPAEIQRHVTKGIATSRGHVSWGHLTTRMPSGRPTSISAVSGT